MAGLGTAGLGVAGQGESERERTVIIVRSRFVV